jgi:hypothetical protein
LELDVVSNGVHGVVEGGCGKELAAFENCVAAAMVDGGFLQDF